MPSSINYPDKPVHGYAQVWLNEPLEHPPNGDANFLPVKRGLNVIELGPEPPPAPEPTPPPEPPDPDEPPGPEPEPSPPPPSIPGSSRVLVVTEKGTPPVVVNRSSWGEQLDVTVISRSSEWFDRLNELIVLE